MSSDQSRTVPVGRLPSNYQTVLDVIAALGPGSHVSAQDVFDLARARRPGIGFTTVHRGLARLHALGLILKLDVPHEASAIYEPVTAPHAHFRCTNCGRIEDVAFTIPMSDLHAIGSRQGLRIASESVTFTGRCNACVEG